MASASTFDIPDCTERCTSTRHGDIITSAISKRTVSDLELCSFLNYTCSACEKIRDSAGRGALHVAASCGRIDLVRWLIRNRRANINQQDMESGLTPLHRALFYGKIDVAVELIKFGANVDIQDWNGFTPNDHIMKDGFKPKDVCGEVYAWGPNTNNSLGALPGRNNPELLDLFHREYPDEMVSEIFLEKFHSVIITQAGRVYSCGLGQGGRLGHGLDSQYMLVPKLIDFPRSTEVFCLSASISKDYSLFMLSDDMIYSCGLNKHRVLGLKPPPMYVPKPRPLKDFPDWSTREIYGICARQFHAVAWCDKGLFTWGLNAGQLGHKYDNNREKYIIIPKNVSMINKFNASIRNLDASDGATVFSTNKGDIYVLHEYQCRKIASRQLSIIKICVVGGNLNTSLDEDLHYYVKLELKIAGLTVTGNVLLWQASDPQLCRCVMSINRAIIIRQFTFNSQGILFVTKDGEAFKGQVKPRMRKTILRDIDQSAFHRFVDRDDCVYIKISKFPRIHRAISIQSDLAGLNYCAIQVPPYNNVEFPSIEKSDIIEQFRILLTDASEDDGIHDIVIKVGKRTFPAHRFILASQSTYFARLLINNDKHIIELENVYSEIFEQFLIYCYTGSCDLLVPGECPEKFKTLHEKYAADIFSSHQVTTNTEDCDILNDLLMKSKNPVRMLQEFAKKMGCRGLQMDLDLFDMQRNVIQHKTGERYHERSIQFNRLAFTDFCDITIICKEGTEIKAHKCVLCARMEYFNNMFSIRWNGSNITSVTLPYPNYIIEILLDYLYTDTLKNLNNNDIMQLFRVLKLADQYFVTQLKEECESFLNDMLSLKNALQLLTFAHNFNATKLKYCCMTFIVSNLTAILEMRILENLDENILKEINQFYFEHNKRISCRVMTPYSTAPSDKTISFIHKTYPVSMDEETKHYLHKTQKRRSRGLQKSKSMSESTCPSKLEETEIFNKLDVNYELPTFDEPSQTITSHDNSKDISVVSNRIVAIKLAEAEIEQYYDDDDELFTILNSINGTMSTFMSPVDFPMLNYPPPSWNSKSFNTPNPMGSKSKIMKCSQKQRKRLFSETNSDISKSASTSETPKNPWKNLNGEPSGSECSSFNLEDIISDEKKQKDNLIKTQNKPLIFRQMEDKAIADLENFYNCKNVHDELITVDRVNVPVAPPIWVQGPKKNA